MDTIKDENFNIVKEIPLIPIAFSEVNELIKEQSSNGIEKISSFFDENQELRDEIIKVANCRYYTMEQNIKTIKGIILTLGIMKFKNIVMTLSLKKLMDIGENNFLDLWKHSIKCGIACEILANENNVISPDDAFSLGFLHDIGKIVIYKKKLDIYNDCQNRVNCDDEDIIEIENNLFQTNHSMEGALILKKWKMPRILVDCITYHHTPTLSTIPSASGIIYVADKIVKSHEEPHFEYNMMNRLGLYISDLKNLKNNIEVKANFYFEALN